jgi:hypothetical protein
VRKIVRKIMSGFDSCLSLFLRERTQMGSLWAKGLVVDFEQEGSGANSKAPLR